MRKYMKKKEKVQNDIRGNNINLNLLRQFDLKGTAPKKRTSKGINWPTLKPSSIVYTCLVLGITIGIGSAFADKEIFPNQKPLDQPIKHKVESQQEAPDEGSMEVPPQDSKKELPKGDTEKSKIEKQKSADDKASVIEDRNKGFDDRQKNGSSSEKEKTIDSPKKEESSHRVRTEVGGALPDTAGNDINQLLLGFVFVLVGAYLIRRDGAKLT